MFLLTFFPRIKVVYRRGKNYANADGLSCLNKGNDEEPKENPNDKEARR